MLTIIIVAVLVSVLIWWINDHQSYFKKRNVKYLKSIPFVGFLTDILLSRKSIYDTYLDIYNRPEFKDEPFFGLFMFHKPSIMIKDPEIIKKILVTDFSSFGSRYSGSDVHDPIGTYQLFMAKYPIWKTLRNKLSPFFSGAKLKSTYYLIDKLGNDLNQYITKRLNEDMVELNLKKMTDLFFVDVVTSVSFGVEAHSLENSGSEFQIAANSIFQCTFWRGFELLINFTLPQAMRFFNFKNISHHSNDFILKVTPEIVAERRKSGIKRHDLIDTLIELKNELKPAYEGHTTDDIICAQVAIFLAAGYETSSITTSFTMWELTKNLEIQRRLREEIREMLIKNEGKIAYESVANASAMPYLNQVVCETLRLYSILPTLDRLCINPQGVSLEPFSDFVIPCGMPIIIPLYAFGRDEKYFPDPLKYDPDRFSPENIDSIPSCVHIPFGTGPRNCIGERLGLIQTKVALCNMLKDFRVEMTVNTPREITLVKKAMLIQPQKDLLVNFIRDVLY